MAMQRERGLAVWVNERKIEKMMPPIIIAIDKHTMYVAFIPFEQSRQMVHSRWN